MSDAISFLDLDIPSARGRRAGTPVLAYMRDLQASDISLLLNPPPKGIVTSPIKALRQRHHTLARLLAEGTKEAECAAITGYSSSRISILKHDPAFKELVIYYAEQVTQVYTNIHERLATLGTTAIEELQDRIEDAPERITNRELMEIAELTLDRSVAPKKATFTAGTGPGGSGAGGLNINIQFTKAMETLESKPAGASTLIESSVEDVQEG